MAVDAHCTVYILVNIFMCIPVHTSPYKTGKNVEKKSSKIMNSMNKNHHINFNAFHCISKKKNKSNNYHRYWNTCKL